MECMPHGDGAHTVVWANVAAAVLGCHCTLNEEYHAGILIKVFAELAAGLAPRTLPFDVAGTACDSQAAVAAQQAWLPTVDIIRFELGRICVLPADLTTRYEVLAAAMLLQVALWADGGLETRTNRSGAS